MSSILLRRRGLLAEFTIPPEPPVDDSIQFPESLLADGIDTSSSTILFENNVTGGGSNTPGSISEVDASTSADAGGIWLIISNIEGTNLSGRLEFMTGAASSEVTWASLHCGYAQLRQVHLIPGFIASGTRLSVRAVMNASGSQGFGFHWGLLPVDPANIGPPLMIGNTGTDQRGVSLTAPGGTNTKGNWTELDPSVDDDLCALLVMPQLNADSTVATQNMLLDIGIGASSSETVLIGDIFLAANSSGPTLGRRSPLTYQVDIPAGTRLSARFASSVSGDVLDVCCVGGTAT